MAGGQERVLRRRIKSVQSTKKITRAMELIAASRIVKAQQRVAAARPYSERITEVIRNLAAGRRRSRSPLLRGPRGVGTVCFVVIAADRGLAGGYNSSVIRPPSGRCSPTGPRARRPRWSPSARRPTATSASAATRSPSRSAASPTTPTYEDARGVAAYRHRAVRVRRVPAGALAYTQFISHRHAAGREGTLTLHCRLDHQARRLATTPRRSQGPRPTTSSSPARTRSSTAAAPLRRGPAVRRAARRGRVRARRPPAGHEVGHRQRRRAHHPAQPGDEPGPPGRHHHRDHGDRRRRRGAAPGGAGGEDLLIDDVLSVATSSTTIRTQPAHRSETTMTITNEPGATAADDRAEGRPGRHHRRPGRRRRVPA